MTRPLLELACGCSVPFVENETPLCPRHGVQRVTQTRHMPAPRIRGVASGPHVETVDLGAFTGRLAGSDPPKDTRHGQ